ncbi:outer membrane protein OmpK [Geothrix sp. PMB-07]|uniref:outer membrane protein OmpK n=1 Tax=Geothrix sp. PMB-07 TaxID=3068640 RepID=UPI0027417287|nr:outer membrane protein OmpK [Geothrix sp. PMB-07]WLT31626.1 outer membrane protein OmpK [Geothrix sp. PMB-07]
MTKLALTLLVLAALPLSASDWSDTLIGYRTSSQFREPGIDGTLNKDILQLSHASGWAYGSNFFNVDMLMSDKNDPAANGKTGANEVYVAYRGALSFGKLSGKDLSFGPVRDISVTAGFDFNSKDNAFASKKRFLVFGPTFNLKAPSGFLDLGLWACHEQNQNGIVGKAVDYKTTYYISAAWGMPFELGGVGAEFKGFANYEGAKGKDGFGVDTKPETLANLFLMFDVSPVFGAKKKVYIGGGLEYWNNKFGVPNSDAPAPGTNKRVTAPMLQVQVHF